jgi:hypothetical protein
VFFFAEGLGIPETGKTLMPASDIDTAGLPGPPLPGGNPPMPPPDPDMPIPVEEPPEPIPPPRPKDDPIPQKV